jgi:peptidoglycan/xylan/chitin deacetylase (PgdA/CDA1 family)
MLTDWTKTAMASVCFVLRSVYFALLRLTGKQPPWTFSVLMYHSVKREEVVQFSRQMDLLKRRTQVVGADFEESEALPGRRYVAVTFDDGYKSVLANVCPVLRRKRIPATVFVTTGYLGRTPGWIKQEIHRDANEELLSDKDLVTLVEEGVVGSGSHTVTHRSLTDALLSREEIHLELASSKRHLEEILGRSIHLFAFPFGAYDDRALLLAKEAGYRRVFLSTPLGSTRNIEGHVAGRIDVSPTDSLFVFWLKAQGAYQFLPQAIAAKARILSWKQRVVESGSRQSDEAASS